MDASAAGNIQHHSCLPGRARKRRGSNARPRTCCWLVARARSWLRPPARVHALLGTDLHGSLKGWTQRLQPRGAWARKWRPPRPAAAEAAWRRWTPRSRRATASSTSARCPLKSVRAERRLRTRAPPWARWRRCASRYSYSVRGSAGGPRGEMARDGGEAYLCRTQRRMRRRRHAPARGAAVTPLRPSAHAHGSQRAALRRLTRHAGGWMRRTMRLARRRGAAAQRATRDAPERCAGACAKEQCRAVCSQKRLTRGRGAVTKAPVCSS